MFFNRQKIFDFVNETLQVESIQEWKEHLLNGTINGSYPIGNMINESSNFSELIHQNGSVNFSRIPQETHFIPEEPLFVLILVTVCYSLIFVAGILGNVITCLVIYRNKSMHTATNYYLFNLAISDLTLLLLGKFETFFFFFFCFIIVFVAVSVCWCLFMCLFVTAIVCCYCWCCGCD